MFPNAGYVGDMSRRAQLRTARLLMRRARPDDLQALHAIMSDPEVMRYWSTPPHASLDETRRFLEAMLSAPPRESDEFVIEHAGEVIGRLGAWRLPEIGFYLRRDCWGRGFAAEALAGFIHYAGSRGVPCLTADVDPLNLACLKLLAAAGFRETGRASATFVVAGRTCDSVYLRLDIDPSVGGCAENR
ncbi:MAG TPA: GNAT family N-acetyltransferase [Caulobacteraceae bacterium]|jgi:RimJ/RimL family protein N-acetyltransferase